MSAVEVIRTDREFMRVRGQWFTTRQIADACDRKVAQWFADHPEEGPRFCTNRPPFFRSGSPYADAILALGCEPIAAPADPGCEVWTPVLPAALEHVLWRRIFLGEEVVP